MFLMLTAVTICLLIGNISLSGAKLCFHAAGSLMVKLCRKQYLRKCCLVLCCCVFFFLN